MRQSQFRTLVWVLWVQTDNARHFHCVIKNTQESPGESPTGTNARPDPREGWENFTPFNRKWWKGNRKNHLSRPDGNFSLMMALGLC